MRIIHGGIEVECTIEGFTRKAETRELVLLLSANIEMLSIEISYTELADLNSMVARLECGRVP